MKGVKSATSSRARPLRGAFLIPPALLVVADFTQKKFNGIMLSIRKILLFFGVTIYGPRDPYFRVLKICDNGSILEA